MVVYYNTTLTNTRLNDVITAIDAGAGSGLLKIGTTGMALVLSTIILAKPCATVSNRVLTFSNMPRVDGAAANTGTAVAAEITTSAGLVVVSTLTVGLAGSGSDIIINQTGIILGDIVAMISGTITG